MTYKQLSTVFLLLLLMIGCGKKPSTPANTRPIPTLNPLFVENVATPTKSADINTPTAIPTIEPTAVRLVTETVYDESLNPNWSLDNSTMSFDASFTEESYSGDNSLAMSPLVDFTSLLFAVREDAEKIYLRDEVVELSFWLYSGDDYIGLEDLAVTVLGSNEYPYWVDGDDSVQNNIIPVFSETMLVFLGINHAIPPDTWVEVTLTLDERIFDPDYTYVTGFYIKNGLGFNRTALIDQVQLLMLASD